MEDHAPALTKNVAHLDSTASTTSKKVAPSLPPVADSSASRTTAVRDKNGGNSGGRRDMMLKNANENTKF